MTYPNSNNEDMNISQFCGSTRVVRLMRRDLLKVASSMMASIGEIYPASNLHIYLSKEEESHLLNRWSCLRNCVEI